MIILTNTEVIGVGEDRSNKRFKLIPMPEWTGSIKYEDMIILINTEVIGVGEDRSNMRFKSIPMPEWM